MPFQPVPKEFFQRGGGLAPLSATYGNKGVVRRHYAYRLVSADSSLTLVGWRSPVQVTDTQLVDRIKIGDKLAFQALASRHADRLFGLAYALLGSSSDAEDVVQETMLAALNGMRSFEGRSSVGTWLRSILVFQSSKLRRSKRIRKSVSLSESEGLPHDVALWDESAISAAQSRMDVMEMLDVLPDEYRQVLVLRELQQMSYEQIAQTLQVPLGTVESRLFRARQMLKQKYSTYAS